MKKIALLFLFLCANALSGMEQPKSVSILPPEVIEMIIVYVHAYDNPDAVIKAIKSLSLVDINFNTIINDMYSNPEGFKVLVHMIANKFNKQPCEIANKFKTPAAEKYSDLCEKLRSTLKRLGAQEDKIEGVKKLLEEGADINGFPVLPAVMTGSTPSAEMIQFLLDNGANPNAKTPRGLTALDMFNDIHRRANEFEYIKALLEEAMRKQRPIINK